MFYRIFAAGTAVLFSMSLAACASHSTSSIPAVEQASSCLSRASNKSASGVRRTQSGSTDPLPSNDDPAFYSTASSQNNYDLGASIIEYGGTSSTGGGGKVLNRDCSSPVSSTRTAQGFIPYNCLDWYRAIQPGIHDPSVDTFLGSTCNYMWVPDGYRQSGGFAGAGDDGTSNCSAGNIDNTMKGCDVAFTPRACSGAKAINQPASDTSNGAHSNRISGEFEISTTGALGEVTIGWEYQTYGGQEYFQFAQSFSVSAGVVSVGGGPGPIIPFRGNVFSAIQGLAKGLGVLQPKLPAPFNQITAKTNLVKGPC